MLTIRRDPAAIAAKAATVEAAHIRAEAVAYLASTDWMVIRRSEAGTQIPADVLAKRAAARKAASGEAVK